MSKPSNRQHWINTKGHDLHFPIDDELLKALSHRPKRGKDLSNMTFNQYLIQMEKEEPEKALKLYLKLDQLRTWKIQEDCKDIILANEEYTMAQKLDHISLAYSLFPRKDVPMKRITDEVANLVREIAQATDNISQIARVCSITRGSVIKILRNRTQ